MKINMRRHLPGPFVAREAARDLWRLSRPADPTLEVRIRGAAADAAKAFHGEMTALDIEWHGPVASLALSSRRGTVRLEARSVIVHEPLMSLYDTLPLASFDARARAFWSRVFTLVRIPGGGVLLKILARRRPRR